MCSDGKRGSGMRSSGLCATLAQTPAPVSGDTAASVVMIAVQLGGGVFVGHRRLRRAGAAGLVPGMALVVVELILLEQIVDALPELVGINAHLAHRLVALVLL